MNDPQINLGTDSNMPRGTAHEETGILLDGGVYPILKIDGTAAHRRPL